MQQSKLVNFLFRLHAEEFAGLKVFVRENCKNAKCVLLFDIISKQYPLKVNSTSLDKKKVFTKLFPGEAYNDNKLLKTMSDLYRYLEQFILSEAIKNDVALQKLTLIQFYFKHSLDAQLAQEIKELKKHLQSLKLSQEYYLHKIRLEEILLSIDERDNNRYLSYQTLYDSHTNFSATSLIKIKNLSLINLKNDLTEHNTNNPIFVIHSKLNYLLLNDDEKNYTDYFHLIKKHQNEIDSNELKTCIILLIDYCIKKVNAKQQAFTLHLFNLFEMMIEHNLLLEENGTITPAIYKNIITIALRLKKLSFTENFLETYKEFLPEISKKDVYLYNKANLQFYQKKYSTVLESLRTSKFKDIFYKLSSRRLQIKTIYILSQKDESYFELLQNTLNAFKKFVYTNQEVTDTYKDGNKNFLKFTYRLLELDKKDQDKVIHFFAQLKNTNQIAEYDWIKESASGFLAKKKS